VQVEYGPLAGTEGSVLIFKNTYRLIISINMLQRSVAVEIDRDCLKPVPIARKTPKEQTVLLQATP
jgi:hypothetical protein